MVWLAKGWGIYWWVMFLHKDNVVRYWKKSVVFFFCKKLKKKISNFNSFLHVWPTSRSIARRPSPPSLVLHAEENMRSVTRRPVQYSQSLTPISVLCSICFVINTSPILLSFFDFLFLHIETTLEVLRPSLSPSRSLSLSLSPLGEPRLTERLRRWREGWLGRIGWQRGSLKMCCLSLYLKALLPSRLLSCLITRSSLGRRRQASRGCPPAATLCVRTPLR